MLADVALINNWSHMYSLNMDLNTGQWCMVSISAVNSLSSHQALENKENASFFMLSLSVNSKSISGGTRVTAREDKH